MLDLSACLPEELLGCQRGSLCLVSRGGAAAEGIADGEDPQSAECIKGEEDEDCEGDEGVHDLLLQPPQVKLGDGNVRVQV